MSRARRGKCARARAIVVRAGREGAGRGARAFFPFFAAALATTGLEDGVARPDRLLGDVVPQYPPLRPSSAGDLAGVRFGDFDARFGGILVRSCDARRGSGGGWLEST